MLFFAASKFPANKNLSGPRGLRRIGVVASSIPTGAMEMCLPCYALCFPMYVNGGFAMDSCPSFWVLKMSYSLYPLTYF
jgi:hypothetical protein